MKILAINPGSTSTKIALFENEVELFTKNITHDVNVLEKYENIIAQKEFRVEEVLTALNENGYKVDELDAFVGRGGLIMPIKSGTYNINDKMKEHLIQGVSGEHASNLGGIIASELATVNNKPSFIVDPVVVDELSNVAKISGLKGIERKSIFHALNQKAVAKRFAKENDLNYEDINLIVAHLGGGTSVGIHEKGKVVDVNNALGGDGAFSPERAGSLQFFELLNYMNNKDLKEIKTSVKGKGGLVSYFGTSDVREVQKLIDSGNDEAQLVLEALAYNVAKEIGAVSTVVNGGVNGIILTGGVAYSEFVTSRIIERVKFIAPVTIYPGEDEMKALAYGCLRVLSSEEKALEYPYN